MNIINLINNFVTNLKTVITASLLPLWVQLGQDIDGEAADDCFGWSMSMNAAGDRVAIGTVYNSGSGAYAGSTRIYGYNNSTWTQLGQDIDGEAAEDRSGYGVSMNAAGDRVAIGAPLNDGSGADAGSVRIYSYNGSTWVKLGQDIDGEAAYDSFGGCSVSMNAAGDRVAIGAAYNSGSGAYAGSTRIYSLSGSTWIKLGQDIDGEAANDQSGYGVSMNAAGDRVAIGALLNDGSGVDAGSTRIYSYNGSTWVKLGQDIDGEATNDLSGYSVSMNGAGDRVAIGAVYNSGSGAYAGSVRVYKITNIISIAKIWNQIGQDIDGEAAGDRSGRNVSINAAGDTVAIGAYFNDGSGVDAGSVRIYNYNGSTWVQLGQDIDGEAAGDRSGYSVSINAAGDRVAIGAYLNDGSGADAGSVRIYSYNGSTWVKLGQDIDGEATLDRSGTSVSINAAGDRVAIGALYNDGSGLDAGSTRIYSYNGSTWVKLGQDIDGGEAADDSFGYSVSMNAAGDRVAIGAPLNDGSGVDAGSTRIYSYNGSTWVQLGQDIDSEAANDQSGVSVSMNAAGDRVAIGAVYNDGSGLQAGSTRIYSLSGSTWIKLGQDIDGEAANDQSGYSVSINAAGDRVAIGAPLNDGSGVDAGSIRVYSYDGSTWTQLGQDIDGEATLDQSGISVSMNAAGDRVAIGAYFNDGSGVNVGSVRIYS